MLDVHPPHSATHTWKDFFIHVGTICVGLLIAVGLEQTVEAIHHHHVREELRRALMEDAKINVDFSRQDLELAGIEKDWALKQAVTIEQAGPTAPIVVELDPPGRLYVPNTGVWLTAKANGDVRLLAEAEQEWLTDLDRVEADIFVSDFSAVGHANAALSRLDKVLLGRPRQGRLIDLASMNQMQRAEAADAFRSVAAADHVVQARLIVYSTYLEFVRSYSPAELENVSDQKTRQHFLDIERRTTDLHPDSAPSYSIVKEN